MKAQPRNGRYFAVGPGVVASATRGWQLSSGWARTPFEFENPDARYHEKRPLVRLWPCEHLVVYSLPSEVDRELGRRAIMRAIALCAPYNKASRTAGHVKKTILIYLIELAHLSVVERRVHYKPTKYRGGAKFSTAAKPKILKTEEIEIQRVAIEDAA